MPPASASSMCRSRLGPVAEDCSLGPCLSHTPAANRSSLDCLGPATAAGDLNSIAIALPSIATFAEVASTASVADPGQSSWASYALKPLVH